MQRGTRTNPSYGDFTGRRFGRLVVLGRSHIHERRWYWLCRCDCGVTRAIQGQSLQKGRSRSCGCRRAETLVALKSTHRQSYSAEYYAWQDMKARCSNPKVRSYRNYGARGIQVCERWQLSFDAFFADMGRRPSSQHSLDRIENDGNYEPGNCRWATRSEQRKNQRPQKARKEKA